MRFLVIEDNIKLCGAVAQRLQLDGHIVDEVHDICAAEAMLAITSYDMILLDLLLPDGDGREFLQWLRRSEKDEPVIVITACRELSDRVGTLDKGADDFLVKPFAFSELEARCRAVLRRRMGESTNVVKHGNIEFDILDGTLKIADNTILLRNQELRLFEVLISAPNRTHSKAHLMDRLFSFDGEGTENAIEVYVGRLRKKLKTSNLLIETVRGRGYRLLCNG